MIIWNDQKNAKLKLERNITFEEISELILNGHVIDTIEHPRKKNQNIFIMEIRGYIYAVPFVIGKDDTIFLKTAFPSRKLHKKYGGK